MTRQVTVAELAEHLSEHLREAESGATIQVVDGDRAIATLGPARYGDTIFRKAAPGRASDVPLPPPLKLSVDILDLLREEKGDR